MGTANLNDPWPAAGPTAGQTVGARPAMVRVEALIDGFRVVRGKPFVVRVQINVNPGFHINSNRPKDKYLIPTRITLDKISGVSYGEARFPSAQDAKFQFSSEPLSAFEGEVQARIPARSLKTLPLGKKKITGKVVYQACDNQTCFPPRTVPFEIPVEVVQ
ncbi:MAG: protein-disulfide reductase DsbD family protein [Acidobacteriia bacterium]|nr:protein-disulfide reductase DsbD family protein [Terriglobia bacterium]